jgi:hypothetical protein
MTREVTADDGETDPNEFLPLIHEALKDDWDAPGMEVYDQMERPGGQS